MKRDKTLYNRISVYMIFLLGILLCNACSKDNSDLNIIHVKVEANSDEPIRIYGVKDSGETGIVIKRTYETRYKSKYRDFSINAICKDGNTLITIKVWVNGKLKKNISGNKYVTASKNSYLE